MATHKAEIKWAAKEGGEEFRKGRFSRAHTISFDGGTEVPASASPDVVGKWAVQAAVDPEEMLVASLSSCHMLSFLHLARLAGFAVTAYDDHAEGTTEEIAPGRVALTKVKLKPTIEWAGAAPDKDALDRLHHEARDLLHRQFGEDGRDGRIRARSLGRRASAWPCQQPLQMLLSMRLSSCWIWRSSAVGPDPWGTPGRGTVAPVEVR